MGDEVTWELKVGAAVFLDCIVTSPKKSVEQIRGKILTSLICSIGQGNW